MAGEDVVIARAGKPLVRLVPVQPQLPPRPLGFLAGQGCIDAGRKRDVEVEINAMFGCKTDQ